MRPNTTYKQDFINQYSHMMPKEMINMFWSCRFSADEIASISLLFKRALENNTWIKDRRTCERRLSEGALLS